MKMESGADAGQDGGGINGNYWQWLWRAHLVYYHFCTCTIMYQVWMFLATECL